MCREKPTLTLSQLRRDLSSLPRWIVRLAPTLLGRGLSNRFREELMLAVTGENRCRYCQAVHTALGRASGLERAEVEAILAGQEGGRTEGERVALAYVRDLARRGFESRDEGLRERLRGCFDEETVEAIEATARAINLANRFGNTIDALIGAR